MISISSIYTISSRIPTRSSQVRYSTAIHRERKKKFNRKAMDVGTELMDDSRTASCACPFPESLRLVPRHSASMRTPKSTDHLPNACTYVWHVSPQEQATEISTESAEKTRNQKSLATDVDCEDGSSDNHPFEAIWEPHLSLDILENQNRNMTLEIACNSC